MPREGYTPQEADVWNYTFSLVWTQRYGLGEPADNAADVAMVVASKAVEALRRRQGRG